MRYILDTSFVIDFLRSEPAAVARFRRLFEDGDDGMVNEIIVSEAATGSRSWPDANLQQMLASVEFVQPGPEAALEAGRWRAVARRRGRTLSIADALIAAAAAAGGATVLTRNVRDFALTPVRVESY